MKSTHTVLAAVVFVLAGSNVSFAQSSFDCRRPRSEAASTICATPQLAERDRQVDADYRQALRSAAEPDRVRDNHSAWATSLNTCGTDRQCLAELLDEELGALEYANRPTREVEEVPVSEPQPQVDARADSAPIETVEEQPADMQVVEHPADTLAADNLPHESLEPIRTTPADPATHTRPKRNVPGWEKAALGGLLFIPILGIIGALLATKSLAEYTSRRFNWPLILNWWNVLYLVGYFGGWFVASFAGLTGGAGFFGAICAVMLIVNIVKTNLLTGLAMTAVQPLVVVIMWLGYCLARGQVQGRRS